MSKHISVDFKWRHYEGELILLCVRWYLRYRLSYRDLAEMMKERGLSLHASTVYRWVQHYAPEIQKRSSYFMKEPSGSWHLDETYIKVKGNWIYLYRAIDSKGQTIDFYLSRTRNHRDAKRFLGKLFRLRRTQAPHTITTDANAAYPQAIQQLKAENLLPKDTFHRTSKYLNNRLEQDHRRVKWKSRHAMGYQRFHTAYTTLRGIETLHMLFKSQLYHLFETNAKTIAHFIERQFGLAAPRAVRKKARCLNIKYI